MKKLRLPFQILKNRYFFILTFLCISIIVLVTFSDSLHNDFVYDADDGYFLVENPEIRNLTWEGIVHLFTEETRELHYYPVSQLSLAIDYYFFGMNAFFISLHNIILHILCSFLVFGLIWKLTHNRFAALFTALLFAIHPLQVEAFIWIYSRRHPLFLLFFLASILIYIMYREKKPHKGNFSIALYLICIFLFICSTLSKTTSVTLPAILLLIDYYFEKDPHFKVKDFLKKHIPDKLPFIPIIIILYFLNTEAASRNFLIRDFDYSAFDHVLMICHNIVFYIEKMFLPRALGVFYPAPMTLNGFLPILYYIYFVFSIVLIGYSISCFRKNKIIFFGFFFYLITLFPLLDGILIFSDMPMTTADRYFYQSSIGLFFLISMAINYISEKFLSSNVSKNTFYLSVIFLIIPVLMLLSYKQSLVWKNTTTLYEHLVKNHPSEEFHLRLAQEYDMQDTVRLYELYDKYKAKITDYTSDELRYMLSKEYNCCISEPTSEHLEKAKNLGTNIYFNNPPLVALWVAYLYHINGDFIESIKYLDVALERNDKIPLAQFIFFKNLIALNDTQSATQALLRYVELELDTVGVLRFDQLPLRLNFLQYELIPELKRWKERIPEVAAVIQKEEENQKSE